MHTIKNIIIIIFCTTLSGCHIYRAYQRPNSVTVSDSLYRQPVAAEDTVSLASLSWKELFTDPQLQQLIETGLNHNTDLNIARLKVKEAEALLMTSRLSYLPSVSLTPQGTLSSTDGSKTSKTYNLAVSADWEIDLFGKLLNAKRGAQAALEQSEAYRQAVQTQLVATIANSYYTLLMLDKQIDEQQSASLRSALRSAELLMQHSSQNYLEVLTARQTLLQAELNTVTDRFDEIQGVINLYHALGGGY